MRTAAVLHVRKLQRQRKFSVRSCVQIQHAHNRIKVQRAVEVRKQLVRCRRRSACMRVHRRLIAQLGLQPRRVNHQQRQPALAGIERIRHRQYLLQLRTVNEAFRCQARGTIRAALACRQQRTVRCDVVNHAHCKAAARRARHKNILPVGSPALPKLFCRRSRLCLKSRLFIYGYIVVSRGWSSVGMSLSLSDFQSFPKAELHRHIDGSVPLAVVQRLALQHGVSAVTLRNGQTISIADTAAFDNFYRITATEPIADLLARFDFVLSLMQTPDGIAEVFHACTLDCASKNIWYVEWTMAPAYHTRAGLAYNAVIDSALRGMRSGWQACGVQSKLILAIQREATARQKPEDARDPAGLELAGAALQHSSSRIAGLGLACDEFAFAPELYAAAFAKTLGSKLGRMPHAGEMGAQRAQNVRSAVSVLGATRIGHGIPVGADPALIALLKQHGVALEANPLSNLLAGFISALEDLRLDELLRAGVCVSINSDDPALFRKELADNFKAVFDVYNWGEAELMQFTKHALASAHMTAQERAACLQLFSNKSGLALA